MPTESFLNGFWTDFLSILGMLGFIATAIGVWMAWEQLRRTATSSEAAVAAINKSREDYSRYVCGQAIRLLSEAALCEGNNDLKVAAMKLRELANLLLQESDNDSEWNSFAESLHDMGASFKKHHERSEPLSTNTVGKWNKLYKGLSLKLGQRGGPFPLESSGATQDD